MSRRKKFVGNVKPPWVGKTKTSLLKRIEQTLTPSTRASVQKRVGGKPSRNAEANRYINGRTAEARRGIKEAAMKHPIDSWVRGVSYTYGTPFIGKVIRIRNGKYTLLLEDGSTASVPFWAELKRVEDPNA